MLTGGGTLKLVNGSSNAMFVDANGNVGIGTTVPTSKLEVVGDIRISGNLNRVYYSIIHIISEVINNQGIGILTDSWTVKTYNLLFPPVSSSGMLVIPVSGIYYVHHTALYTSGGNNQYHDIIINGAYSAVNVYRAYADNGSANINVRGDFIIPLNKNDTVSIMAGANGGTIYGNSLYHHTYIQIFQIN